MRLLTIRPRVGSTLLAWPHKDAVAAMRGRAGVGGRALRLPWRAAPLLLLGAALLASSCGPGVPTPLAAEPGVVDPAAGQAAGQAADRGTDPATRLARQEARRLRGYRALNGLLRDRLLADADFEAVRYVETEASAAVLGGSSIMPFLAVTTAAG